MKKNILIIVAAFLIGNLKAQSIKRISYLNAIGDSIRFSICRNIIDTLMANKKVDMLIIKYDEKSDYYQVNEENIRAINYEKINSDSVIISKFVNGIKSKFKDIPRVLIDSIGTKNISNLEEFYFYGRSANTIYLEVQNPIESWESLKLSIYYLANNRINNSRFSSIIQNFPKKLSIPVKVYYNNGKISMWNYYLFNYEISYSQIDKFPNWNLKSKNLLY